MWMIDFSPQAVQAVGPGSALVNVRNGWAVLVFPQGEGLRADWSAVLPPAYQGQGLRAEVVALFPGDSNPADYASFELVIERVPKPGGQIAEAESSPPQVIELPVPASAGTLSTAEAYFPPGEGSASLTGGDLFRLRLRSLPELSQFAGACEVLRILLRPSG